MDFLTSDRLFVCLFFYMLACIVWCMWVLSQPIHNKKVQILSFTVFIGFGALYLIAVVLDLAFTKFFGWLVQDD